MSKKEIFKFLGFSGTPLYEQVIIVHVTVFTELDLEINEQQVTLPPSCKEKLQQLLRDVCKFLNLDGPLFFQEMILVQNGEEILLRNSSTEDDCIYIYRKYKTGRFQTMIDSFNPNHRITLAF